MIAKKVVTILLLIFVAGSVGYMIFTESHNSCSHGTQCSHYSMEIPTTQAATSNPQESIKTIVYYLHGNVRCRTCNFFETTTESIVKEYFDKEIKSGKLTYIPVNVQKKENSHFIEDFQLVSKSIVLARIKNGKVIKWKNLEEIWNIKTDKSKYVDYIKTNISEFIK